MQKNMIAIFLSIVLVTGSVGTIPVLASEVIAEDAMYVLEEAKDDVPEDNGDIEHSLTVEPSFADETIQAEEENPIQDIIDTTSIDDTVSTEEEDPEQDTDDTASTSEAVSTEEENPALEIIEATNENMITDDQIVLDNTEASEEVLNGQEETIEKNDAEKPLSEITEEPSKAEITEIIDSNGIFDEKSTLAANAIEGLSTVEEIWQAPRIETDVTEAAEGCVLVGIPGEYLTGANAMLNLINEIRKEACDEGVLNPNTGEPLTPDDYVPIKWSGDLEYIARIRAAESALTGAHARTNGRSIWGLHSPSGIQSNAEVLAWNGTDLLNYGIYQWYSEKDDWVNQNSGAQTGHYTSMINPRNRYVGLGVFCSDNVLFHNTSAGEFSRSTNLNESRMEMSGKCVQMLEVLTDAIGDYRIVGTLPEATGDKQRLMLAARTGYSLSIGLAYFLVP